MTCYEYICPACKKRFERDFRIGTAPQTGVECPRCGSMNSAKAFSAPWVSWVVYPHNNPLQNRYETRQEKEVRMETAGGKYIE